LKLAGRSSALRPSAPPQNIGVVTRKVATIVVALIVPPAPRPASTPHPPGRGRSPARPAAGGRRSEEHTSELRSRDKLVCRLLLYPIGTSPATLSLRAALPIFEARRSQLGASTVGTPAEHRRGDPEGRHHRRRAHRPSGTSSSQHTSPSR